MTIQPAVFIFNKDYIKKLLSKNDPEMLTKGNWLYSSVDDIVHDSLLTGNFFLLNLDLISK